jgi:hypothetical protein
VVREPSAVRRDDGIRLIAGLNDERLRLPLFSTSTIHRSRAVFWLICA